MKSPVGRVMIEHDTLASAHSTNHIHKHLHLTSPLHIKHREHTKVAPFEKINTTNTSGITSPKAMMQELSILKNQSFFRDPPVSPLCQSNYDLVAVTDKVPFASLKVSEHANKEKFNGTGALEQKRKNTQKRMTRAKVFLSRQKNHAMNTRGRGSLFCSARSSRYLSPDRSVISPCDCQAHHVSREMVCSNKNSLFTKHNECISSKRTTLKDGVSPNFDKESVPISNSFTVKYAPKSFADIFGQHVVTHALSNALASRRVAPMYIFYGPHGTGKTSCANLFALALNCLSIDKNRPCWTCRLCLAQLSGKFSPIKVIRNRVKQITSLMKDISGSSSFLYRVCLVEECSSISSKAWIALLKGIKTASKKTVFIFTSVSLEHIPYAIVSQCQKFHFSNISEKDIICKLQMIAMKESLNADSEAIELIASTSNGSIYDAELMINHCCLHGKKITVPVVQDLVGLIPDSKLMELLDFAFSAETVKTIESLKAFLDSGVKPSVLLSQLASLITRILAGGHHIPRSEQDLKFFCKQELTKHETQRLRQALRILSEAEMQVQLSSSGTTWLIAALLQFAPYPPFNASSCSGTSLPESPERETMDSDSYFLKPSNVLDMVEKPNPTHLHSCVLGLADVKGSTIEDTTDFAASNLSFCQMQEYLSSKVGQLPATLKDVSSFETALPITEGDNNDGIIKQQRDMVKDDLQLVWQRVLDAINSTNLKCFLQAEGKLVALSTHEDSREALLEFHRLEHLSRVQRSSTSILHAFHATLGHRIKVRAHLVSRINKLQRSNSGTEAAEVGPSQWAQLIPGNNECNVSSFLTSTVNTRFRHGSPETQEVCEPQIVSEVVPAVGTQPQIQRFLPEDRERGMQPSMSTSMLHDDINKQLFAHKAMQMKGFHESAKSNQDTGISSLEKASRTVYVIKKADGTEGCKLGLQLDIKNTMPRGHSLRVETAKSKTEMVAAKLHEQNLKKESKVKESVCWKAGNHISEAVESFQSCSEHSKFFLNFFPCASIPRSSTAL